MNPTTEPLHGNVHYHFVHRGIKPNPRESDVFQRERGIVDLTGERLAAHPGVPAEEGSVPAVVLELAPGDFFRPEDWLDVEVELGADVGPGELAERPQGFAVRHQG